MNPDQAVRLLLGVSPFLAVVNYISFLVAITIVIISYKINSLGFGVENILFLIIIRYGVVSLIRWNVRRKVGKMTSSENA